MYFMEKKDKNNTLFISLYPAKYQNTVFTVWTLYKELD